MAIKKCKGTCELQKVSNLIGNTRRLRNKVSECALLCTFKVYMSEQVYPIHILHSILSLCKKGVSKEDRASIGEEKEKLSDKL